MVRNKNHSNTQNAHYMENAEEEEEYPALDYEQPIYLALTAEGKLTAQLFCCHVKFIGSILMMSWT
jgi:hypothetical protein